MRILETLPLPIGAALFLPLSPLFLLAAPFAPAHRRVLPDEPADPDLIEGTNFLVPVEHIEPDEDERLERLAGKLSRETLHKYAARDGARYPEVVHEGHGSNIAMARGTLEITSKHVESLPAPLRVGLFAAPASYPVVARFNYRDLAHGPIESPQLALKIHGLAGQDMDLLMAGAHADRENNAPFFLRDPSEIEFLTALPRSLFSPRGIRQMTRFVRGLKKANEASRKLRNSGALGHQYSSALQYRLGSACIMWGLAPLQSHALSPEGLDAKSQTARMFEAARAYFSGDQPAAFDLSVTVATADGTAGPIRCCEDNKILWDPDKCGQFDVGRLTFPAGQWDERVAEFGPPAQWSHQLEFNIGRTPPEHEPIGANNRLRRRLYALHNKHRLAHMHGLDAPSAKCPFG